MLNCIEIELSDHLTLSKKWLIFNWIVSFIWQYLKKKLTVFKQTISSK